MKSKIWPLGRPLVKGCMECRLCKNMTAYPACMHSSSSIWIIQHFIG